MTPQELVKDVAELVSMPAVALRINAMVDDTDTTASDIGQVIAQDPGLTVRLLKIANSPLYGLSSEIDTVSRAVTVLGTKQIRDLVLATAVMDVFEDIPNDLITLENFWLHSITCGLAAAELIGQRHGTAKTAQGDSIFIAGLLHDIGTLIIFKQLPQQACQVLEIVVDATDISLAQAEQQVLGFDHAQVGAELAKRWQLPKNIYACVAYHHQPSAAGDYRLEATIVHIANALAIMVELEVSDIDANELPPLESGSWERVGLDAGVVEPVIAVVKERLGEVSRLFMG